MTKVMLTNAIGKTIKCIVTEGEDIVIICFTDGTCSKIKANPVYTGSHPSSQNAAHLVYP